MNTGRLLAVLITLFTSVNALSAQQPQHRAPGDSARQDKMMSMDMQQQMKTMDSITARLDTLVRRMNRTTGDARVMAMAQVINALVAERHVMQAHMHRMMRSRGMMDNHMMMDSNADSAGASTSAPQSAGQEAGSDSSEHAGHHPQK